MKHNKGALWTTLSPKIYTEFLPISRADMEARGWDQLDFVVVGGDAYVDHPSFGTAIISRLLEAEGYKVGVRWPSPVTLTARTSSGTASPSTASSSAAATWTAWSATIPWQKFPAPRMNTPPAARAAHARTAAPPCTPSLQSRLTPTCR